MNLPRGAMRVLRRTTAAAALCLAAAGGGAGEEAGAPLGSDVLLERLVPVTGEASRSVDLTVSFAKGSAALTAAARRQLDELGAALASEELRGFGVGVYGHTDASGPAAYNLKLSAARAAAAVDHLVMRFAFDRARFQHRGHGEERLLEGVAPRSPRQRRVEIVVFAPAPADKDGAGANEEKGENGLQAIE